MIQTEAYLKVETKTKSFKMLLRLSCKLMEKTEKVILFFSADSSQKLFTMEVEVTKLETDLSANKTDVIKF